jgi:hypothetical protein
LLDNVRVVSLHTPPVALVVPEHVFDAFGWCESDHLEWRTPTRGAYAWSTSTAIAGEDPARMVFVLRSDVPFLPRELARLHAFGLGLKEEWALAPYAIDDATDELYAHRAPPGDLLWLAADNLNALYWGLHDWAHFHNHGPFEARAWTELQCDTAALSWMALNRDTIGLDDATWTRLRAEVEQLARSRFVDEGAPAADLERAEDVYRVWPRTSGS